ncbi:MAG: cytochrome c [Bacteroidetes bacterium]|nr:cytochrome c [Bacteroidota bacterium]
MSCYKDNEEDLYPGGCNTENVKFSTTIQPIFNSSCVSCHSGAGASAGIRLSNHSEVVAAVDGGRLLGAIKHQSGFSAMPPSGPKLTDCQISQIEAWVAQGKPNN